MSRLQTWVDLGDRVFDMTPEELVRYNVADVVKSFVKDEPHSNKKLAEKRYRIIASFSIVDQIIERLLCSRQNSQEIEEWETCPSKPGLGLHDEGLRAIGKSIERLLSVNGEVMCTDVSGWDWSVQKWELDADAQARAKLAGESVDSLFGFLLRVNAHCVANSVYVDPLGSMWAQTHVGSQLSGRYNTSSSNSRMRVMMTMMARLLMTGDPLVDGRIGIDAMGDDSVEVSVPGIEKVMEELGHSVKMVKFYNHLEGVEFCSQVFNADGTAYPATPGKTVYRFCSRKPSDTETGDLWSQLAWYMRHLSGEEKEKIVKLGVGRVSGSTIKIAHGEEASKHAPASKETRSVWSA